MGLTTSLSHALTGLRATETGLETVSRNIANAGVQGYARRRILPVAMGQGGVTSTDVQRTLDGAVQRQLRVESGAQGYTSVAAGYLARLDASFGAPGGASSLDTMFNGLTAKLRTLAAEPANETARAQTIAEAKALASGLNRMSSDVQSLRNDTETAIAAGITEANAALQTIEKTERQLASVGGGNARADLLDERDRAIDTLSQLMDIRVAPRGEGGISIFTTGGASLFTGQAARLTFEARGPLGPQSMHATDPSQSTVGEIGLADPNGAVSVLHSGMIRSGEIGGLLSLRDETLPAMQRGLDGIAAGLANATSEAGLPMFIDAGNGTGALPFMGGAQELGFSGRIAVDPALARDPAALSPGGSPARAQALLTALSETPRSFAGPLADGATFTGNVGGAIRNVLDRQGAQSAEAARLDEGQSIVVNALASRFSESSGVSVDQEMAQLIDLQNAYAANARIVSVVQDMYDALMRI